MLEGREARPVKTGYEVPLRDATSLVFSRTRNDMDATCRRRGEEMRGGRGREGEGGGGRGKEKGRIKRVKMERGGGEGGGEEGEEEGGEGGGEKRKENKGSLQ